eukprot:scaffold4147_cov114-Isochrysis_galbana.AAC.4
MSARTAGSDQIAIMSSAASCVRFIADWCWSIQRSAASCKCERACLGEEGGSETPHKLTPGDTERAQLLRGRPASPPPLMRGLMPPNHAVASVCSR